MTEYAQLIVATLGPPSLLSERDCFGTAYFGTDHHLGGIVPYEGWEFVQTEAEADSDIINMPLFTRLDKPSSVAAPMQSAGLLD